MRTRLTGVVVLGAATLFLGTVPAYADGAIASTTVVTAPSTTAKYVEWSTIAAQPSTTAKYVEWSRIAAEPTMVVSKYVEW